MNSNFIWSNLEVIQKVKYRKMIKTNKNQEFLLYFIYFVRFIYKTHLKFSLLAFKHCCICCETYDWLQE